MINVKPIKDNNSCNNAGTLTNDNNYYNPLTINEFDVMLIKLRQIIRNWDDPETEPPTNTTIIKVQEFISDLNPELRPVKVVPTAEEGLCVIFKDKDNKFSVDFYNDGDITILAKDNKSKEIFINKYVNNTTEVKEFIENLFNSQKYVPLPFKDKEYTEENSNPSEYTNNDYTHFPAIFNGDDIPQTATI